jgi:inward rectifier potassium channel
MTAPKPERGARPMQARGTSFDLRKRGVTRLDFRDRYHVLVTISWPVFVVVVGGSLLALNLIFALLYTAVPGAVQNLKTGDVLQAFFFSLETMATVGYGEMAPASTYGHVISSIEIVVGMTFTAIFTGMLFVRFSRPQARILFAENAVVTPHDGKQTLMLRIANGRLTMLTHAVAKLHLMVAETTHEGRSYRRVYDLDLIRNDLPVLPLTWTLMHVIDETSPLFGLGPEQLKAVDARLFVTVEARDAALGAEVQDAIGLDHSHILFGLRYRDAVLADATGAVTADIAKLSEVE